MIVIRSENPMDERADIPEATEIVSAAELEESYSAYLTDESRMAGGHAERLVFVHSEKQIAGAVKKGVEYGGVTISAARTGITGGSVPMGGMLLSLERMDCILGVRWAEEGVYCLRTEPGISLQALNDQLLKKTVIFCGADGTDEVKAKFLEECDQWFYPVDPTEKTAHIGGTVATNASGARSFHYGQTRVHVTALRIVLSSGDVLALCRGRYVSSGEDFVIQTSKGEFSIPFPSWRMPAIKNAAGYYASKPMDLIDCFIGSEGTLGIISEVEVALARRPEFILAGVAYFEDLGNALDFVKKTRNLKREGHIHISPAALEYFGSRALELLREKRDSGGSESEIPPFPDSAVAAVYFEQPGYEDDVEDMFMAYDEILTEFGTSMDQTWGGMEAKELAQMAAFRHALPEAINTLIGQRQKELPELHKVGTDFALPDEGMEFMMQYYTEVLEQHDLEYAIFGHIGENHVHVNMIPRSAEELELAKEIYMKFGKKAVELGGSVSGEHGLGKLKKTMLKVMYGEDVFKSMQEIKKALDPEGILNPGTLI